VKVQEIRSKRQLTTLG